MSSKLNVQQLDDVSVIKLMGGIGRLQVTISDLIQYECSDMVSLLTVFGLVGQSSLNKRLFELIRHVCQVSSFCM